MKVVHLIPEYSKLNEEYLYLLIRTLYSQVEDTKIFSAKFINMEQRGLGCEVLVLGRTTNFIVKYWLKFLSVVSGYYKEFEPITLNRKLLEAAPDIIHAHFGMAACNLINYSCPIVVSMHGYDGNTAIKNKKIKRAYESLIAKNNVHFTFPSEYFRANFSEKFGLPKDRSHVLRNSVNLDLFFSKEKWNSNAIIISCIGRFIPVKNQLMLIRLLAYFKNKGISLQLILVGFGPDEVMLKTLASELDVLANIDFKINISREEIAKVLSETDIYIQPSIVNTDGQEETFCIAVMEALASGCCVVVSDGGAMKEIYSPIEGSGVHFFDSENLSNLTCVVEEIICKRIFQERKVRDFTENYSQNNIGLSAEGLYSNILKFQTVH